jgi:acylphosphatase
LDARTRQEAAPLGSNQCTLLAASLRSCTFPRRISQKPPLRFFSTAISLLQFCFFVNEQKQARKYLVSGVVQGVGFRYFTQRAAARLKLGGYVRNLRDGRVEVFAMGTPEQLDELCSHLERGPRFSSVSQVLEESATLDVKYEKNFVIGITD